MDVQRARFESFARLHERERPFVVANAWDAGSARLLTAIGFEALATTSAGFAFSKGRRDSFAALSRADLLANAQEIVAATDLPVSADLEDGFGREPDACAATIAAAIDTGLVGGSIEDATGDPTTPIHDFDLSVERIAAAAEAKEDKPFMLTARAENWLWDRPDLDDTIRRLQAFCEAGADVVYAPGLPDLDTIRTVCAEVPKPVNVVMGLKGRSWSVEELGEAGVRRISVGGSFARAALGAVRRAALEVLNVGTFDYATDAIPDAEIAALMAQDRCSHRT